MTSDWCGQRGNRCNRFALRIYRHAPEIRLYRMCVRTGSAFRASAIRHYGRTVNKVSKSKKKSPEVLTPANKFDQLILATSAETLIVAASIHAIVFDCGEP